MSGWVWHGTIHVRERMRCGVTRILLPACFTADRRIRRSRRRFLHEMGPGMRTLLRRDPGLLEGTTVGNDEIDLSGNDVLDDYLDIER